MGRMTTVGAEPHLCGCCLLGLQSCRYCGEHRKHSSAAAVALRYAAEANRQQAMGALVKIPVLLHLEVPTPLRAPLDPIAPLRGVLSIG